MRGVRTTVSVLAGFLAVAILLALAPSARASLGPTNNFGSSSPNDGIYLADSRIQEYSLWPGYMGWSSAQTAFFRGLIFDGVENTFEPSDLTVTLAPDNTVQDVKFVPVPNNVPGGILARADCDLLSAAIYGTPHHRVCDKKQVTTYPLLFTAGLTPDQFVYNVLAHEFGHTVGLRHSNSPCPFLSPGCVGISASGAYQWNTFLPTGGLTSLMHTPANPTPPASSSLSLYDYANINLHY